MHFCPSCFKPYEICRQAIVGPYCVCKPVLTSTSNSTAGWALALKSANHVSDNNTSLNAAKVKANTTPTVLTPVESPTGAILTPTAVFPPAQ